MSYEVFVGNINWDATDEDLAKFFSQAGEVISATIKMKPNGQSRGFGFVAFETEEEREKAKELDGADFLERPLTVNDAQSKKETEE